MADRPAVPRIPPLAQGDANEAQQAALDGLTANANLNIFKTLAHHPRLFNSWLPFGGRLLQGSRLPSRDRELVILRVAFRCRSKYEWGQHVGIGRAAGLTDEEIRRVAAGPDDSGWTSHEAALLRVVDELHEDDCITDATWAVFADDYTTEQLIELPMLAGHYALLAGVLNSLGVQTESRLPALGESE